MILTYSAMQLTRNFHSTEFQCNDENKTQVPNQYLQNVIYLSVQLQKIRDSLNLKLLKINSGYRTVKHNTRIRGSAQSNHLTASASDIVQFQLTNDQFYNAIQDLVKNGIIPDGEILKYDTFVHYAPRFEAKHYPQLENQLNATHVFTYNKNINHSQYSQLTEIRKKYKI